ncbi:VOC family protein [Leptolyngbya sp. FACHB-671]|uniref:VOC family protein n=1 Tax=Leptolyngbya sp. FACHB-671 TaxID=2692812 RepID=UPI00168789E5|nr:VOC family protein [Leptolyngbya sp. FACHB-671]MBD1869045.1 VOC family protein [Cyanobacteria bacterium FACHB-471]MBD2066129.1 VOC family protein [Leptolyngbya sp. FACHB-671]
MTIPAEPTVVADSTIAAYLSKGFFQLAYVTNNFEAAQVYFKEKMGVNKFMILKDIAFDNQLYMGKPSDARINVALAGVGNIHIELIQPISGANPYSSFLDKEFTLKLHHVGLKVDDWQEVERDLKSANREFAYSGNLGEAFIFGYLNMVEELGHFIEFIWAGPEGQKVLDQVTSGNY